MQFIAQVVSLVLSGFLALSSGSAELLSRFTNTTSLPTQTEEPGDSPLSKLPSSFEHGLPIPNILLQNADYQKAALITGFNKPGATAKDAHDALVNVFCTYTTSDYIRTTTGTGFFVHPDGVVMTNAHVAQFLLLETTDEGGKTSCILRTGSPAMPTYKAELLYIPPSWISEHANLIAQAHPTGTGERDYALLYVTAGLDNRPMPQVFPSLQMDTALLPYSLKNTDVEAAGYPADALVREGADVALIPRLATTTISEMYTFGSNYADVVSLRGSDVGEQGSSGGPVLAPDGRVIGMISTRGDDSTEGAGSLRAITISHIDRTIREETGYGLEQNVTGNLPYRAQLFEQTLAPFLTQILSRQLQ